VLGVEVAGVAVASVLAGPVVDRLGHKWSSVWSDVLAAAAVGAVPVLHHAGALPFLALLALAAVLGITRAPGQTARTAMMPALIELAGTSPQRAMGAYDGVSRTAKGLGAPLAGILIALTGAPALLLIDAGTFLVSAALIARFVPGGYRRERRPYLRELLAGFAHLRADRLVGAIVLMVMLTNMLDMAAGAVLIPVYAKDVLHSSVALGLIAGVFAGGAVAGNALYGWRGERLPNWPTYTAAFLVVGAPRYVLMAAEPGLPALLIWMGLAGVLCGAINPILDVVLLQRLPVDQRAKVLGLIAGGVLAAAPLGAVLAGVGVEVLGLTATLLLTGAIYLLATLCPLVFRTWREMDAH
jgi:MFS family permease